MLFCHAPKREGEERVASEKREAGSVRPSFRVCALVIPFEKYTRHLFLRWNFSSKLVVASLL